MLNSVLKPTKCSGSCGYSRVTSYCIDCPALMCSRCDLDMHRCVKHTVLAINKMTMDWNDKSSIMQLFEDMELGTEVFREVNRKFDRQRSSKIVDETPEPVGGWMCESCSLINERSVNKCAACCFFRNVVDHKLEYNSKLNKYEEQINALFFKLDDQEEVPLENVVLEYLNAKTGNYDILRWFKERYIGGKSLHLINIAVQMENHQISMESLEKSYNQVLTTQNDRLLSSIPHSMADLERNARGLVDVDQINSMNDIRFGDSEVVEDDLWKIIQKKDNYTQRQNRMLITELHLESVEKVALLRASLNHAELGPYLIESCPKGNVKLKHLRQAVVDQILIDNILNFLKKDCVLCCEEFPMPSMKSLLVCSHEFCKLCLGNSLESMISSKYPCKWGCPMCPDESYDKVDKTLLYYNIKEVLVECKCSKEIIKIFDEKLLAERLKGSPNFHWCANEKCVNGFEAEGLNRKVQCPGCKTQMCLECNREWKPEHENATCQEYELFMLRNDPNLAKILNDIGIECPQCKMRYALAPGGCLHFDCRTCGFKFCGGCYVEFTNTCRAANCTLGDGFHGHHPRNCIYFLRDYATKDLETLLQNTDYPKLINKPGAQCPFLVTEEKTMINRPCGDKMYGTTGLCEKHYREYLVQFINRNNIDPANFANSADLNLMLFQGLQERLTKNKNENEDAFVVRLRNEVIQKCQLYIPKGLKAVA